MKKSNRHSKTIVSIENKLSKVDNLLPNKAEFDKVIRVFEVKSRKHFFQRIVAELNDINDLTDFSFNRIVSIMGTIRPNTDNLQLTHQEIDGFINHINHFLKHLILHIVSNPAIDKTQLKELRNYLSSLNVDSNFMFEIDMIPDKFIDFLDTKSKKTAIVQQVVNDRFFEWNLDEKKLKKLFDQLIAPRYQFIEEDYTKFKSLFIINNTKQGDKSIKIKWIKKPMNYRALGYLFHRLCEMNFICEKQKRKLNQIISVRLLDFNGKSISLENLKKSYSRFDPTTSNAQYIKDIDNIISSL